MNDVPSSDFEVALQETDSDGISYTLAVAPELDVWSDEYFTDRETIADIASRKGETWRWCAVAVRARIGDVIGDWQFLGGCSYVDCEDFKNDRYYSDLKSGARDSLLTKNNSAITNLYHAGWLVETAITALENGASLDTIRTALLLGYKDLGDAMKQLGHVSTSHRTLYQRGVKELKRIQS